MESAGELIAPVSDKNVPDIYNPFGMDWKIIIVVAFVVVLVAFAFLIVKSLKNSG